MCLRVLRKAKPSCNRERLTFDVNYRKLLLRVRISTVSTVQWSIILSPWTCCPFSRWFRGRTPNPSIWPLFHPLFPNFGEQIRIIARKSRSDELSDQRNRAIVIIAQFSNCTLNSDKSVEYQKLKDCDKCYNFPRHILLLRKNYMHSKLIKKSAMTIKFALKKINKSFKNKVKKQEIINVKIV